MAEEVTLFKEARKYIPGGVNSPVRSFRAVGGYPVFVKNAQGSRFYGECGGEFIDYCLSWGALILGHAHPEITEALEKAVRRGTSFGTVTKLETELAGLIVEALDSVEQVRLTNSGTEAVMGAIRLARAYTNRNKIIKFEGAYHGHADYLLAKAGSGAATLGMPDSLGVPKDFTKHTIMLPYNDIGNLEEKVKECKDDLAAIIVEPVAGNNGLISPAEGFLEGLRKATAECGAVLVFDEVITGFRLSYTGAQGFFGVKPDLTCLGKIIGGGLPIGAFGGRRDIMKLLAPEGGVYQAGTLSGNPVAVTAGVNTLKILKESAPYDDLARKTEEFCRGIRLLLEGSTIDAQVSSIGSMFNIRLNPFKSFYHGLLKKGIYLSPSEFETNFLSTAHSAGDLEETLKAIGDVLKTEV